MDIHTAQHRKSECSSNRKTPLQHNLLEDSEGRFDKKYMSNAQTSTVGRMGELEKCPNNRPSEKKMKNQQIKYSVIP
jgi:hypothetical protein